VQDAALSLHKAAPQLCGLYAGTQINELLDDNGPFATEVDDFTVWVEAMHDSIRRARQKEGSTWTKDTARTGVVEYRLIHMSIVGKVHGLFHSEFYPPDYYDAMARCLKYDLFH
jgi:hypothetical protein